MQSALIATHRPHLTLLMASLLTLLAPLYLLSTPVRSESSFLAPRSLPPGFKVELYASGMRNPRFVSFTPEGDLYTVEFGQQNNRILALPDRDHDGKADRTVIFASGFVAPNNVVFRNGAAYVGEPTRVTRLQDTNGDLVADTREVFISGIPGEGRHRTRTLGFGPDGRLYLNVGSFYDDAPEATSRATIWQYNADGSGGRVYASGLRNTVGFDWDPTTGLMWGVDNGVDELGRNLPPDELNQIVDGGDYGYPYCYGDRKPNPNTPGGNCARTLPPALDLPAHSAPLGMAFYNGWSFPSSYWGGLFIAEHSIQYPEDRTLAFVPFKDGRPAGPQQVFHATGDTWVGVAVDPYDGSLFASQDRTGRIYKISYTGQAPTPAPPAGRAPTAVPGKPAPQPATQLPGMSRCFRETGKCLRGAFLNYWFTHGGLEQFGFPVTGELTERLVEQTYTVQYTERARLEWHPENRGKESQVLLGRLGADLAAPRANEQPFRPVGHCESCGQFYFAQTGHTIAPELRDYWQRNGGIPVFGYPLSEAFQERSPTDGKMYLVQYFERNRLEYHPENRGTRFEVLLGLVGVQTYQGRYGARP